MEATIQSTNRAINIDINISINVDALKAIIQRWLQAIKQRVLSVKLSLPRLYRMVLLMSRAAVRTIDAHPTLSNIFLWIMCAACFWAVLTYNFTTHI